MGSLLGNSISVQFLLFSVSLMICALFSFLETSITSMRLFKIKELAQAHSRYQHLFEVLEKNPHRILITILVATSLANVTLTNASTELTSFLFAYLPPSVSMVLSVVWTSMVILIFGEILPKNIAKAYGDRFFESTLWITNMVFYLMYPFVTVLVKFADYVVYKLGDHVADGSESIASEKEVQFLIDYIDEQGLIEPEKTAMLKSIFELGETGVKQIMVPATEVVLLKADTTINEAMEAFHKRQFSRFPVYEGDTDNIIGMLHLKDLLVAFAAHQGDRPIRNLLRPIMFVPEMVKVNQLLKEFKQQHRHIATVLDEHGSVIGMVTLEDVLEEIVGEIHDEYEEVTEKIVAVKPGVWLVNGSMELDRLGKLLNISFNGTTAITLAGFLTERLQHVPRKGERIAYHSYYFQIHQATPKRVSQVLVFADAIPDTLEITD